MRASDMRRMQLPEIECCVRLVPRNVRPLDSGVGEDLVIIRLLGDQDT